MLATDPARGRAPLSCLPSRGHPLREGVESCVRSAIGSDSPGHSLARVRRGTGSCIEALLAAVAVVGEGGPSISSRFEPVVPVPPPNSDHFQSMVSPLWAVVCRAGAAAGAQSLLAVSNFNDLVVETELCRSLSLGLSPGSRAEAGMRPW